jgi:hyperpolarization activated cyclic nucleotide-gated potassium channel 1
MLIKYVNDLFKLNAGFERLIFFVIISVVFCHICCCFWVILANLSIDDDSFVDTWIYRLGYVDCEDYEVYIASMYFVLATFTTVGFGDINGVTNSERVFCLILMLVGALAFSFSISSLSSMLSTMDTRKARFS